MFEWLCPNLGLLVITDRAHLKLLQPWRTRSYQLPSAGRAWTAGGVTMALRLHAGRPGGEIAPPKGYKYEAQVEFTDHVTPANPEGSLAAAAVQEVCNLSGWLIWCLRKPIRSKPAPDMRSRV